jgi:bifunctional NMN adenylyltransferase/nudix hydrolase
MAKYDYAVLIGRMQPPHKEHISQIKRGLELADKVIVAFGSHRAAPNIKNPFSTKEREDMVRMALSDLPAKDQGRVLYTQVRDYYYNDTAWFTDLHNSVNALIEQEHYSICVIGCIKDESSWYLEALPEEWKRELSPPRNLMSATDIRELYFHKDLKYSKDLDDGVANYLLDWSKSELFSKLADEWQFIENYKEMWAKVPYPVTFVTTDAIVVKNAHVLLVRRKFNPGKGLLALPGGFVNQNESVVDSAIRELKEETRILVPKDVLIKYVMDDKVFDNPNRSLRGRTITHAYCIKLPDGGPLPQIKAADDAERAIWMPIADLFVKEDQFYEDHAHIIEYFVRKI